MSARQRYDNQFPHNKQSMSEKALRSLAYKIHRLVETGERMAVFRDMVRLWNQECLETYDKYREWSAGRDSHAQLVNDDARLRDENAGPPDTGWKYEGLVLREFEPTGHKTPPRFRPHQDVFGGWLPPHLSADAEPHDNLPLHLPSCKITLPEKYAALGAIHDAHTRGADKIDPWAGSEEFSARYRDLLRTATAKLPERDERPLRAIIAEIRRDLEERTDGRERRTKSAKRAPATRSVHSRRTRRNPQSSDRGFYSAADLAERNGIPPERRRTFARALGRLRPTLRDSDYKTVENRARNEATYLYRESAIPADLIDRYR